MALIECAGCGHRISSRARRCPKCGHNGAGEEASGAWLAEQNQEKPEDWYYVSPTGRSGPTTLESLHKLVAEGKIAPQTPVWKAGMADWVALSRHREQAQDAIPPEPPPIGSPASSKVSIWALALAPAWGMVLQIIATEVFIAATRRHLGYYSELWWIMAAANLLVSWLDFLGLKKSGRDLSQVGTWTFLLVPAYLYLRDKKFNESGLIRLSVWIVSLVFSVSAYLYLNGIYARLSLR